MQSTPFTLPTLASGLVAVGTAVFVMRKRVRVPAAREFVVMCAAVALMCFAYAGELTCATLPAKLAWLDVRWVGISAAPLAALALALRWNGDDRWLRARPMTLLAAIPVSTLLLAWADPLLHFVDGPSVLLQRENYVLRTASSGPGFWIFVAHAYLCLLAIVWVYGRAILSSPIRRRQGAILLAATLLPWIANAIYVSGSSPDPGFDVSHVGYGLACVAWAWGLGHGRLFELVPVARDRVFESLADAVLVLDAEKRVVDHNPAAAQVFGAAGAMTGKPLSHLVGEELAATLSNSGIVHWAGREWAVDATTVRGARSSRAMVLTLRDVTLQRQAEVAREEALRLAEEAGRARAQFLARMSHEVRGPLYGVVGAADLLLSSELAPEPRRYAEAVASSSRVLLALVDELLDFSKIDADRLHVELHDFDGRSGLDEVASLFAGAAEKKRLALRVEAPEHVWVRADAVRLRQVLVNLVGNAVKFTDRGSITVRARREGERCRFEVTDTGIGIAEASQARIFEPFIQIGAPARSGPAGTGLGLAIARRLVGLMGGELGVTSRPGAGSTFWFTLPAFDGLPAAAAGGAPGAVQPGPRGGRVLVVDDNPVNRLVTCGLLVREGCEVEAAENAAAALDALAQRELSLVLTDVRMPGTTGLALAEAIRQLPGAVARIPVVAVTGDVHEGAREEALKAGANDWLAKPVDPGQLRRVLERWLPHGVADSPAPVDLRTYLASDPVTYAKIEAAFRASVPAEVAALLEAASVGEWARVRELAHALKGACAVVGARELEELCRRLLSDRGEQAREPLAALEQTAALTLARLGAHQPPPLKAAS